MPKALTRLCRDAPCGGVQLEMENEQSLSRRGWKRANEKRLKFGYGAAEFRQLNSSWVSRKKQRAVRIPGTIYLLKASELSAKRKVEDDEKEREKKERRKEEKKRKRESGRENDNGKSKGKWQMFIKGVLRKRICL